MAATTLYELLEVPPTATQEEIKAAYRQAIIQVHPDRGGNRALFRLVQEAYETLSDEERRSDYDRLTFPGGNRQEFQTSPARTSPGGNARDSKEQLRELEVHAQALCEEAARLKSLALTDHDRLHATQLELESRRLRLTVSEVRLSLAEAEGDREVIRLRREAVAAEETVVEATTRVVASLEHLIAVKSGGGRTSTSSTSTTA
jgi:curved DNA-binding protein CbpA